MQDRRLPDDERTNQRALQRYFDRVWKRVGYRIDILRMCLDDFGEQIWCGRALAIEPAA
jgi:hypothetical protein